MSTDMNRIGESVDNITDDAHALLDATADVAGEKVAQARSKLMAALAAAKDTCASIQKKAIESAKVADKTIRENPYQSLGVAFGLGALIGFLISRRDK